jgi:hypothetical protein
MSIHTTSAVHRGVVALSNPARIEVTRVWANAMSTNGIAVSVAATTSR